MRKVKQGVERPYLIFRHGCVGRTLYDSQRTLDAAKGAAKSCQSKRPKEKVEVFCQGELQFTLDAH